MFKRLQFILFTVFFLIVIVTLWVFLNSKTQKLDFSLGNEAQNLKQTITSGVRDFYFKKDLNSKVQELKKSILSQAENQEEVLKQQLAKKMMDTITTTTPQINLISYKYEPWKIEFQYDEAMQKEINDKNQTILLFYNNKDEANINIRKQKLTDKNFSIWLSKNYDLQKLNKEEFNNIIFWSNDIDNKLSKIKEYYFNVDSNIYIIRLSCKIENIETYWNNLILIVQSIKKY